MHKFFAFAVLLAFAIATARASLVHCNNREQCVGDRDHDRDHDRSRRDEGFQNFDCIDGICVNLQDAAQLVRDNDTSATNLNVVESLFKAMIWYNNTVNPFRYIYSAIGLPSNNSIFEFFAPNASIYAVPFGGFNDPVAAALYYLVPTVWQVQVPAVFFYHNFGRGNQVHLRSDIGFGYSGVIYANVTEVAAYTMNANNRIGSADAVAYYVGKASNPPAYLQQAYLEGFCADMTMNPGFWSTTTQKNGFCSSHYDPLGFYANYSDCMAFVSSIPFGTYDDGEEGSFICRLIHTQMSFFDPAVHCPHAGKTGGGFCVPHSYNSFYQRVYKRDAATISAGVFGPGLSRAVAMSPPDPVAFAAGAAAQARYNARAGSSGHSR